MAAGSWTPAAELKDLTGVKMASRTLRSGAVLAGSAAPEGTHLRSGDGGGNAAEAVADAAANTALPHQQLKRRCRRELDALGGAELTLAAYVPRAASASAAAAITSTLLVSPHRAAQHQQAAAPLPVEQLPLLPEDVAMLAYAPPMAAAEPPAPAPKQRVSAKRKPAVDVDQPDALQPAATQPEVVQSSAEQQAQQEPVARRSRPSQAGSRRKAAAAELAALIKEDNPVDLPRLRSRGQSAPKPQQSAAVLTIPKPLGSVRGRRSPWRAFHGAPADKAEVSNPQDAAPAVSTQQTEAGQQKSSVQQPSAAPQTVPAPDAEPQVQKGSKELRMLTADMSTQPELPARRSRNAVSAPRAIGPVEAVPADQPTSPQGQPGAVAAVGSVPRPRILKRKQAPAPSAKAATPGQQPQQQSREVRQRISRDAAAHAAADGRTQPKEPAAKADLPLSRSHKTAAKDQTAAPTADLQHQKVEQTAKQDAGSEPLPAAGELAPSMPSADLTALVSSFIEVLKPQPGSQVGLRQVMASGLLQGKPLAFCDRQKQPKMHGTVSDRGMIACSCAKCVKSGAQHSSSEWEVHAGSRERRPAESIYLTELNFSLRELCLAIQAGAAGVSLEQALPALPGGSTCTSCGRPVQGCAPRLCRACGAAAKAALKRGSGEGPPSGAAKSGKKHSGAGGVHRASGGAGAKAGKGGKPKGSGGGSGGGGAAKARVHLAQPAVRGVTAARAERSTHRHKKLFTSEPGALTNGEPVEYRTTQGERLLGGVVMIDESPGGQCGILCDCCATVVSCSQFEAHAGKGSRRAPYDHIFTSANISLRRIAELMPCNQQEPETAPQPGASAGSVEAAMVAAEEVGAGCVLCGTTDFLRGAFGERTMLLCDQCEREFHVGCLRSSGRCVLESIPEGDWFCSATCSGIHAALRGHVKAGVRPLPGEHSWQIMRGKDGTHATTWALKAARDLLSESFDPIIDAITGRDMLAMMVMAQAAGPWDYTGMHCVLLRHKGKPVAAALVRVFGRQLAELPLVATQYASRRQGHARVLMSAIEGLLAEAGVQTLSLPAAQETVGTWMHGFAFDAMPEEQLAAVKKELRIIIFPGSTILSKRLMGGPPPTPQAPRHMQATEDGAAAGSEDSDQAAEPALQLLHAHPAVASRPEPDGGAAPPAQQDDQQQPLSQAAAADTSRDVILSSTGMAPGAAPAPSADGLSGVSPPHDGAAAPNGGPAPAAEGSSSDLAGAGAADLATAAADPASTAAEEPAAAASLPAAVVPPISAEPAPTAAASDLPVDGAAAAAGDKAPAVPGSPRRIGKRNRLDRLRQLLGLTCSEEILAMDNLPAAEEGETAANAQQ